MSLILLAATHYSCTDKSSSEQKALSPVSELRTVRIMRESIPEGAPTWLNVRIQTSRLQQIPILETTGVVFGIPNRELAINAASSRALHEASAWLQSPSIQGLNVVETAFSAKNHWAAARIQVPLPENWVPPKPLPESKLP